MIDKQLPKQLGFSLIELMIAMVIGMMLLAGVISVFSGSQKSFNLTHEISSIQENARFAMDAMAYDVRHAGYHGCSMTAGFVNIVANDAPSNNFLISSVRGAEVNGSTFTPSLPAELQNLDPSPVSGSDVLMLQYASPITSTLNADMNSPSDEIILSSNDAGLDNGDMAIISDCDNAELFTVTNVQGNTIQHQASQNTSGNFTKAYKPGLIPSADTTRVSKFNYVTYYVGDSGRVNEAGNTIYSLYSYDMESIKNNEPSVELIEGVENIQFMYGIEDNSGLIRYINANNSNFDPGFVRTVQIGFLIGSVEEPSQSDDDRTYNILETSIGPSGGSSGGTEHPKDNRVRVAFNTTIKVRNRREIHE